MKQCFLFHLKSFFPFTRYLRFCLEFLFMQQNGLIRKMGLISNLMTLQSGQQTILMHILSSMLRSKGNWRMKFGQLIGCNMRNIFLEKGQTKCDGETSPRPFSEKLQLRIYLDQQSKVLCSLFLLYAHLRAIETC